MVEEEVVERKAIDDLAESLKEGEFVLFRGPFGKDRLGLTKYDVSWRVGIVRNISPNELEEGGPRMGYTINLKTALPSVGKAYSEPKIAVKNIYLCYPNFFRSDQCSELKKTNLEEIMGLFNNMSEEYQQIKESSDKLSIFD